MGSSTAQFLNEDHYLSFSLETIIYSFSRMIAILLSIAEVWVMIFFLKITFEESWERTVPNAMRCDVFFWRSA